MKFMGIMNLSLQHIQAFLAVVEYKNMTKAASCLNVTQPLLSQKISALEYTIGMKLFIRDRHKLILTPAGQYLNEEWGGLISSIENSIENARLNYSGVVNHINIGFCQGINWQRIVDISGKLSQAFPNVKVSVYSDLIFNLREKILNEELDLIILPNYEQTEKACKISYITIKYYPLVAMMNQNHPLAQKEKIEWADLCGVTILCQPASSTGNFEKLINNVCNENGFAPEIISCNNMTTVVIRMAIGEGVIVGTLCGIDTNGDKYVKRTLDYPPVPVVIGYNKNAGSQIAAFADEAAKIIRDMI